MLIRDFEDGQSVEAVLLVRESELRRRRDGGEYLRLLLGDRTGSVAAVVWDDANELAGSCQAGQAARVRGRYSVHARYGPQLVVHTLTAVELSDHELGELTAGPPRSAARMEGDLRELIATVHNPHLRDLLDRLLAPGSETWAQYRAAPAAKHYHQAYPHGLLEHSLSVAQAVSAISATFPGIDRDIAVTGALLHDIGKLDAYTSAPFCIDLTDAGKLQGEIALGYYRIRREIEHSEGFPAELAQALLHIILAHHGTLEHGSPVVPCTREATLVHMIDNLGGRLGSFDRLEKELADGSSWSSFDRALGGGAYFASRAEQTAQAA